MACDGVTSLPKSITIKVRRMCFPQKKAEEQFLRDLCVDIKVPLDAKVDDIIAAHPPLEGCCGFFAVERESDDDYDDYDDYDLEEQLTGLAQRLAVDGGVLLALGNSLSFYGIDTKSCSEVTLFGVFADEDKQPMVFKKDLEKAGFGDNIYKYVKLHTEDKEMSIIRRHFVSPLLPWLAQGKASEGDIMQTVEFSMEDKFTVDNPRKVLTVSVNQDGDGMLADCTNVAGVPVCSIRLAPGDLVAKLKASLCKELQWASVACWNGSDQVVDSEEISQYSLLTAEQINAERLVSGCYQNHTAGCRPAGYSASGTQSCDILVLEPGKAGLQSFFKGDYKRAEELRQLVMSDAQWSVESLGEGKEVIRIAGKAALSRRFVHERSGSDGADVSQYTCHCLVTIPAEHLLSAQTEQHHHASTKGSGWTCGSEDYKCSFFLPMPLLSAVRVKPETENDASMSLRAALNAESSPNYPYNKMQSYGRHMCRGSMRRINEETVDVIRRFREGFVSKPDVSIDEL